MKKLTLLVGGIVAIVGAVVIGRRHRRSVQDAWAEARRKGSAWSETASEVEHDLGAAAREAARAADELGDDLEEAARQAGKAADAASEAVDEFNAAVQTPPDHTA